jgi:glycosyltransferase involved in cell wall biosynthesis
MYRKGVDVLLEAFDRVQHCVQAKASLVFIGPRGDAHHLIGRSREGVVAHSPVSQPELRNVLSGADCFVLPSRHDSFGMVVAEAMACGLPAIVSTMVGAKDLIEEGRTGWVVPVDDVAALAERMGWCVEHREEVRGMRGDARATAQRHDWVAYRRRFSDLIRVLIGAGA